MPASVAVTRDPEGLDHFGVIALSEVSLDYDSMGIGDPLQVFVKNTGTTALRDLSILVRGEGAHRVQLARDAQGVPGIWQETGDSVSWSDSLYPDQVRSFWTRGVYSLDDLEDSLPVEYVVRAKSVG
jgi:hypothetical protein